MTALSRQRLHLGCVLLLATLLAAPAAAKSKAKNESLLIGRINDASKKQPLKSKDTREWIESTLVDAVRRAAARTYKITTMSDLSSQLEFQHLREQMGCDNQGCLAEIAGMTGAKYLLFAKLMQAGQTFAFQISLIDQQASEVVKASVNYRFPWSVEACEQAIHGVVGEVFLGKPPQKYTPPATAAPTTSAPVATVPAESQAAFNRLTQHMTGFRYRALLADARAVLKQDLPDYGTIKMAEYAAFCVYQAHFMLKEYDQAAVAGERFLARFKTGTYVQAVRMGVANVKRVLRTRERGKAKAAAELKKIATQLTDGGAGLNPIVRRSLEFQRCTAGMTHQQYDVARRECDRYVQAHAADTSADTRQFYLLARWNGCQARAELGEFTDALACASRLVEDETEFADQSAVETIMATWPQE